MLQTSTHAGWRTPAEVCPALADSSPNSSMSTETEMYTVQVAPNRAVWSRQAEIGRSLLKVAPIKSNRSRRFSTDSGGLGPIATRSQQKLANVGPDSGNS